MSLGYFQRTGHVSRKEQVVMRVKGSKRRPDFWAFRRLLNYQEDTPPTNETREHQSVLESKLLVAYPHRAMSRVEGPLLLFYGKGSEAEQGACVIGDYPNCRHGLFRNPSPDWTLGPSPQHPSFWRYASFAVHSFNTYLASTRHWAWRWILNLYLTARECMR